MRPEFLSYRFAGVKKPDQILSHHNDVGWKCRKYIRWRQVHSEPGDEKILKAFADGLIEKTSLDLSVYGRISSILLNVQKWRLDREHLAIDPPSNEAWEYVNTLLQVAKASPQVMVRWLTERSVDIPESSSDIQIVFYLHLLDEFLSRQSGGVYSASHKSQDPLKVQSDLREVIARQVGPTYESVGVVWPKRLAPEPLMERIYDDFGFAGVSVDPELVIDRSASGFGKTEVFISYKTLEGSKLLRVNSIHGNIFLELNESHPFIQRVRDDPAMELFEAFFKCYALSMIETASLSSAIDTLNSYLEIHLKQEFSRRQK